MSNTKGSSKVVRGRERRTAKRRPADGDDQKFRELADLLPQAVFECDVRGRITYANHRAFEYYGFTIDDYERGVNIVDTMAVDDRQRMAKAVENRMRGEESGGNEYLALRKDGSAFPVIVYSSVIVRNGRPAGLRGVVIDVTDRKRVENALRESEELFRNIIEKSTNFFYTHSPDHVFTYLSPQIEGILGYRPEEALVRWTDLVSDNPVNERAYEITQKAIETGERQKPYEVEAIAKDGRRVWLEVHEAPLVRNGLTVSIIGAVQDMTERKRIEEELQKLVAVVHSSGELVNLATLDGTMIFLNEAGGRMLGIDPAEVKKYRIIDVIPEELRELVNTKVIASLLKGGTWEGDLKYRNIKTGALTDVHVLAFAISDSRTGGPLYFANVSRDITERKRAEKALRERQAKLDSIFRAAPTGIGFLTNRIIMEVNDGICEMTGYSREELVGQSARMLYMTDQEFEYVGHEKYRQIALQGIGSVETRWRRKDGSAIDVLLSSAALVAGDLSSGVAFTALDITARKRSEEALRASEKKYRQLIETLQEGIWVIDRDGRTTFVNPRMAEMLGRTADEMLGKHLFSFMDDRGIEECRRYLGRRRDGVREQHDFEFLRKNGERIYVSIETSPLTDEHGNYAGAIAGVQDNTARRRTEAEQRLLEMRMHQAQKLESLGVLAGGIAHDFNNILMAIRGNLEFAVADLPPESPAQQSLTEVDRASLRAVNLCKQLLAYSGKGRFTTGLLDLAKVVEEMAKMLGVSISKKADVRFDLAPGLPLIEADETQIQQVVMNLIINASEALGEESGTIIVSTGAIECDRAYLRGTLLGEQLPEGRYAYLEVADTGCGMDAQTQAKIFDPFFTTKFTGRGLGLAAVLGIVRGHRGTIKILSEKGTGTTFRILFPASTCTAEQVAETPAQEGDWRGSGTVLLADDEEMVRSVAKRMLEHLGYRVLLASDGVEAVEVYRAHHASIACVILDLTMPRKNGAETLAALREIAGDVRVILSSGYSEHDISKRFAGEGFAAFIEKPYRLSALDDTIRSVFREKVPGGIDG